jgi:hypothetical protein
MEEAKRAVGQKSKAAATATATTPPVPEPPDEDSAEGIMAKHAEAQGQEMPPAGYGPDGAAMGADKLLDIDAEVTAARLAEEEYDDEIVEKQAPFALSPRTSKTPGWP